MENVLLIINPVSGKQKARRLIYGIVNLLSECGHKTTVFATTKPGDATELVQKYGEENDRIICCGGDGTLNEVFTGMAAAGIKVPVGYIPTGTTNDLANSLGLASSAKKAMHHALHGNACMLDLGTFNHDKYFSYVASFGAFSNVAYETPQWLKNRLGRASYLFYGISEVGDIKSHRVRIIADGMEIDGDFIYGSVSNSRVIGGLVKLPEDSIRLDDGKFEVMLIKTPRGPIDLHNIVQGLVNQDYVEDSVLFFTAGQLTFVFEDGVPWTVDGEYAGENRKVEIGNLQQRISVFVE
jgi:YegS/Rv2252/BmrU family lipid kinase